MTHQATTPKQVQIALQYPCFICKEIFGTAVDVKSHVLCVHHYYLPDVPSDAGKTRPAEDNHVEFKELPPPEDLEKDAATAIKIHSACPSCWFHRPARDMLEFEVHIIENHNPCSIDTTEEQGEPSTVSPFPPEDKEEDKQEDKQEDKKQVTEPTVEDLFDKLDDLADCMGAYLGGK